METEATRGAGGSSRPLSVGRQAGAKLLAPLPLDGWEQAIVEIRKLGLRTVVLEARRLSDGDPRQAAGALDKHKLRPVALEVPASSLTSTSLERLQSWAALGVRLVVAEGYRGAEEGLAELDSLAAAAGVTILIENDPAAWPADGPTLGQATADPSLPHIGACYNPAAAVALRRHPFLADMMSGPLKRTVQIVRLRDALFSASGTVPVDLGNAELRELVSALEARSYSGWYALDLPASGPYSERLAAVHTSVQAMLDQL